MNKIIGLILIAGLLSTSLYAGNKERAGQAGAQELLINPWTRTSGMAGSSSSFITGIEAVNHNVAGLAQTDRLEILYTHRNWLNAADIDINSLGFSAHVGESGVVGVSIMSMSFGEIENTTVDLPGGGIGTYTPLFFTGSISYARAFSSRISGGITLKVIHEEISNIKADGMALDAGVNYTTGIKNQIKFGIAIRNVGPAMKYKGSGLTVRGEIPSSGGPISLEQRSQQFELPSLLNIGLSYDFLFNEVEDTTGLGIRAVHRLTPAFTFTSNSFSRDQFRLGAEYAFKERFMARFGYILDGESGEDGLAENTLTGLSAGATVKLRLSKRSDRGVLGLDFSWQQTDNFGGISSLGLRLEF